MRIKVSGVDVSITNDQRAYTEYRVFTSIAPHGIRIRAVDVIIRRDSVPNRSFVCTIVVDLDSSGRIKTQARGAHPSAAIDSLRLELRAGTKLGNGAQMIELGPPSPFQVGVDRAGVGPVVVAEQLETERNWRLPR